MCQTQQFSETQLTRQFDISPDTTAIGFAHTDMSDGPYVEGRSLFKATRKSRAVTLQYLNSHPHIDCLPKMLQSYQFLFDGRQWPQQLADPQATMEFRSGRWIQQYADHSAQTGLMYNSAGPESYEQWFDAGLLIYTTWPRANSNATRLQINENFNISVTKIPNATGFAGIFSSNLDLLVFTKWRRSFLVSIMNGRVMKVETAQNTTDGALTG